MTEKQYLDAIEAEDFEYNNSVRHWGRSIWKDYFFNIDIPSYSLSNKQTRINIANYYYFWFPLVKGSLQ